MLLWEIIVTANLFIALSYMRSKGYIGGRSERERERERERAGHFPAHSSSI